MAKISHKALYQKLEDSSMVASCVRYAYWTIPKLMASYTAISSNHRAVVERDYQEIGAMLVNNLATKLARLLFPASFPFFRVDASPEVVKEATNLGVSKADLASSLAMLEKEASARVFLNAGYAQLIQVLTHLIVTGNVLLLREEDGTTIAYGLQNFVVRRDGRGRVLDIVLRELTYVEALQEDVQTSLRVANPSKYGRPEQQVELYTRVRRHVQDGRVMYKVTQEIDTYAVGKESSYPEHLCPYVCATWSLIAGEHYGRGMVEDYAGGFAKISDLSESQALYCIEVMRVLHLVSAASGTDPDDFANAETGEYIRGDKDSVTAHEAGDAQKLEQISMEIERVFMRLAKAFMYNAGVRDAERVTAYELRRDSQEADNALGGAYSTLATVLQVPLANLLMKEVSSNALAGLVTGAIKPKIIAGIPALGRSSDVQNLMDAATEMAAIIPVAQLDKRIDPQRVTNLVMSGRSVDTSQVFYSKEELAKIRAAEAQMQQGQNQLLNAASVVDQSNTLNQLAKQ